MKKLFSFAFSIMLSILIFSNVYASDLPEYLQTYENIFEQLGMDMTDNATRRSNNEYLINEFSGVYVIDDEDTMVMLFVEDLPSYYNALADLNGEDIVDGFNEYSDSNTGEKIFLLRIRNY